MATTSPDSIYFPSANDSIAPLETVFANLASSVQTALNSRSVRGYRWANAAARTVQAGMTKGDRGFQSDTSAVYVYDGTTWVAEDSGWKTPALVGGNTPNAQYRKKNGIVYLQGTWVPTADSQILFRLDSGFRPGMTGIWWCERGGGTYPAAKIEVQSGGSVIFRQSGGTGAINFASISFIADN